MNPLPLKSHKECIKCGCALTDENWNKSNQLKRNYICVACSSLYKREWANRNPEKSRISCRKRMRRWRENNPEKSHASSIKSHEKRKEKAKAYSRAYSKENRVKKNAQLKASAALKRGDLIKKPCERCGNTVAEMHHPDYSKPLEIKWLCSSCHKREHVWKD